MRRNHKINRNDFLGYRPDRKRIGKNMDESSQNVGVYQGSALYGRNSQQRYSYAQNQQSAARQQNMFEMGDVDMDISNMDD